MNATYSSGLESVILGSDLSLTYYLFPLVAFYFIFEQYSKQFADRERCDKNIRESTERQRTILEI